MPNKLSASAALVLGLVFIALGLFPMLSSIGIGPLLQEDINGPPWLGFVAGMIFVAAGLAIIVGRRTPLLSQCLAILILAGMAAIGNWIAFGVGERMCSGSITLLFLSSNQSFSDLGCRIPFGFGALMVNAILVYAVISLLQKMLGGPPKLQRLLKLSEWLILLSLGPLLIPLLLILLVMAVSGAIWKRVTSGSWPRNEAFLQRRRMKQQQNEHSSKR
jgi:hypothetical protein